MDMCFKILLLSLSRQIDIVHIRYDTTAQELHSVMMEECVFIHIWISRHLLLMNPGQHSLIVELPVPMLTVIEP